MLVIAGVLIVVVEVGAVEVVVVDDIVVGEIVVVVGTHLILQVCGAHLTLHF